MLKCLKVKSENYLEFPDFSQRHNIKYYINLQKYWLDKYLLMWILVGVEIVCEINILKMNEIE